MKRLADLRGLLIVLFLWHLTPPQLVAQDVAPEPIVFYDLTPIFSAKLADETQRWRFWDESQLVFALQGIVNRSEPRLFVRFIADADDFWWEQMTRDRGWLAGRKVEKVTSVDDLLNRFRTEYRGSCCLGSTRTGHVESGVDDCRL